MGLTVGGIYGEVRLGRHVVARMASWSKDGPRIQFALQDGSINEFWASYGAPTTVALAVPGKFRVYEIDSGDFRAGTLTVKVGADGQPIAPRVESR